MSNRFRQESKRSSTRVPRSQRRVVDPRPVGRILGCIESDGRRAANDAVNANPPDYDIFTINPLPDNPLPKADAEAVLVEQVERLGEDVEPQAVGEAEELADPDVDRLERLVALRVPADDDALHHRPVVGAVESDGAAVVEVDTYTWGKDRGTDSNERSDTSSRTRPSQVGAAVLVVATERSQAAALQVSQDARPALRPLAVPVLDSDQLLGPVTAHAKQDQRAQAIVLLAAPEVHAVGPHVHVVLGAQVPSPEGPVLLLPRPTSSA